MAEYIERKAAIDACFDGWNNQAHDCAENIRAIPAADVRLVVRGEWIDDGGNKACSECHKIWLYRKTNFCPHCGADMRPEEGE